MQPATAAIIGAGLIGRAWAMVFARAGWQVHLYDNAPAQLALARTHIATSLAEQQAAGLVDDASGAAGRGAMVGRGGGAGGRGTSGGGRPPPQVGTTAPGFPTPAAARG